MSEKIIAVALDIDKIPYVNNPEVIFTLGKQKIWYTRNTVAIEIPKRVKFGDLIINKFIKKFWKKSNRQDILSFKYFTRRVTKYLKNYSYDKIVFENDNLKNKILPHSINKNNFVLKVEN